MSARVKTSVAVAIVAFGLVAGLVGAACEQFVIDDDFSSGVIDPARWAGLSKLIWNPIVGQFTFTVKNPATQGTEAKSIVYSPDVSDAAPPTLDFRSVRVLNRVENCASGRKRVQMEARFDAVEVMRQP